MGIGFRWQWDNRVGVSDTETFSYYLFTVTEEGALKNVITKSYLRV